MILTADYHTHTKFSHGKGNVLQNAIEAKQKGLVELGITDHGFAHPAFGLRAGKLAKLKSDCELAKNQTGVNVLVGIESNVRSTDGTVDLKPKYYDDFDLFLAGIHKLIMYKLPSWFSLSIPNLFYSTLKAKNVPKSLIKSNTKAFVNVIKNNPVDVITHLNFCCFADVVEVAKVASDYGTYLELNAKKVHLSDEQLYAVCKTGVNFVINSDAHSPERVGEISLVIDMLKRVDVPADRIMNIDGKLPNFRFKAYKGL